MSPPDPEKLRRVHMDSASCSEFSSSAEGIKPLIAPGAVERSRKDPNKGLYPKTGLMKSNSQSDEFCFPSFSKASDIYAKRKRHPSPSCAENELPSSSLPSEISSAGVCAVLAVENVPANKRSKKEIPSQSNKITSYLSKSDEAVTLRRLPQDSAETKCLEKISVVDKPTDFVPVLSSERSIGSSEADPLEASELPSGSNSTESKEPETDKPEYFGLFGATEMHEDAEPDHFNEIPVEVMEHIFSRLTFRDLQNCKRVCHLWNDVITNRGFIHWKMMYYKLKYGCQQSVMHALLASIDGHSANNCLHALVRFMRDSFSRKPAPDIYDRLTKHRKFVIAESVLKERFPEWGQNLSPWCIITAIVLVSEEVSDVSDLIHLLLRPGSQSLIVDILEVLYCIASFLLYCMNSLKINHGLHYRVYYALYMYENYIPVGLNNSTGSIQVPGQQTMHNYCTALPLTCEQKRIVAHKLQPGDVIKVVAFAGTGKTSTLIELARRYPHFTFLNLMFNKSVCEYAQKIFPKNVKCQTAHSLAYETIGRNFRSRLSSKFSPDMFKDYLDLSTYPFDAHHYCKAVIITIQKFMSSNDIEITLKHTPKLRPMNNVVYVPALVPEQRLQICRSAVKMWAIITDPNQNCHVTHDVYLKLYQLSKPVIDKYNCIMIDEAQDCNPAMLDIILSQKVPILLVGDPHQQIYGFRGSKNALRDAKSTHIYHLTRSFRFGPEIAYVASCCIEVLKHYRRETLIGSTKPGTVQGVVKGQYAIITRTNIGLFNEAIRMCCLRNFKHEDEPRNIHGAFIGGINSYGLNQVEDIYRLKNLAGRSFNSIRPEERPQDKFIKNFLSFSSLISYSERKDDPELTYKIELVLHYADRIPEYMKSLRKLCSTPLELANVVFTTAHKAKGFEFETVRLGDDFSIGRNPSEMISGGAEEEYNIMYVAVTRAKTSLFLTEKLYNVLLLAQEKFEYPILSEDVMQNQVAPACVLCFTPLKPHTVLSLIRRKVVLTTGRVLREGPLCMKCAIVPYYRPQVIRDPVIMYLDPMEDFAHRSLRFMVGPLPSDPPIADEYDTFRDLHAMDLIYVINVDVPPDI